MSQHGAPPGWPRGARDSLSSADCPVDPLARDACEAGGARGIGRGTGGCLAPRRRADGAASARDPVAAGRGTARDRRRAGRSTTSDRGPAADHRATTDQRATTGHRPAAGCCAPAGCAAPDRRSAAGRPFAQCRGAARRAAASCRAAADGGSNGARVAAAGIRLGGPRRREALFGHRRDCLRVRGGAVPAVLRGTWLAPAPGPRPDWRRHRHRAAARVRAESGAPVSGHRQRARRRGRGHPLCHLLRGPRALEPDPRRRRIRSARDRDGGGRAAVGAPRIAVHRRAGVARRVRHSRAALVGREPADRAVRVSDAAQHRARMGRVPTDVAAAHGAHARVHDHLSMDVGVQVPRGEPAAARDGDLPRIPRRDLRGAGPGAAAAARRRQR